MLGKHNYISKIHDDSTKDLLNKHSPQINKDPPRRSNHFPNDHPEHGNKQPPHGNKHLARKRGTVTIRFTDQIH